jgi:8-oxo-dGTP pyrophosphatase MutT (NUDIX family)
VRLILGGMSEFARRSGRVLVLDAADRLLLIRLLRVPGQPEHGHEWFTPGGGVEAGEDVAVAAARELREETGLRVSPDELVPVAYTTGQADLGWVSGLFRDDFFLHRVVAHQVDSAGLTDFERTYYGGYRWWTQAELAGSSEIIYPVNLAALVTELIAGRVPASPAALPWHH